MPKRSPSVPFWVWLVIGGTVLVGMVAAGGVVTAVIVFMSAGKPTTKELATVYVAVPQTTEKPTEWIRTKPTESVQPKPTQPAGAPVFTEPVKPADPWYEAREHFKKVKETEKEKTEAKLKKLDKQTESLYRHWMNKEIDLASVGTGTETRAFGVILWEAGFTEYINARSTPTLQNKRFLEAFRKLNSNPTADEIVTAALRFTVTRSDVRDLTLDMIENDRDTRNLPQTHKAATAWTGK